jgi:hypothetical protein
MKKMSTSVETKAHPTPQILVWFEKCYELIHHHFIPLLHTISINMMNGAIPPKFIESPNDGSTPQNQTPINLQLKLTWHLTCIPPDLIEPNLLNSCSTISTVASKGKFLTKIEYPGSAKQGSVTIQNKPHYFLVSLNKKLK